MSEWVIVAVVGVVLLFSAKKLPDMARGLGQSMRIFKAETRGMKEDDQRSRDDAGATGQVGAGGTPAAPGRVAGAVDDEHTGTGASGPQAGSAGSSATS